MIEAGRSRWPVRLLLGFFVLVGLFLLAIPWFLGPPGSLELVLSDDVFGSDLSGVVATVTASGGREATGLVSTVAGQGFVAVVERLPAGEPRSYTVAVPGYKSETIETTIPVLGVTTVPLLLTPTFGRVEAVVVDAVSAEEALGGQVRVSVGDIAAEGSGKVMLTGLPPGRRSLEAIGDGFCDYQGTVEVRPRETVRAVIPLARDIASPERFRFILDWDAVPRDLDAHLVVETPSVALEDDHVYFSNKEGKTASGRLYASLDHDWLNSEGFETLTVFDEAEGNFRYFVHRYSSDGQLATSGAQVRLLLPGCQVQSWRVPTSCWGRYWHVADIRVADGEVVAVERGMCPDSRRWGSLAK